MGVGEWLALIGAVLALLAQVVGIVWYVGRLVARGDKNLTDQGAALRKELSVAVEEERSRREASLHAHANELRGAVASAASELREEVRTVSTEQRDLQGQLTNLRLDNERRFAAFPTRDEFAELLKPLVDGQQKQGAVLQELRDAMVANNLMGPRPARRPALIREDNGN